MNNKVQILLSIMNLDNYKKQLKKMNVKQNFVIVNQITNDDSKMININNDDGIVYSYRGKGLSASRNKAIDLCNSKICMLSDDDMFYYKNYFQVISSYYEKYPDADVICFAVDYENKDKNKKRFKEGKIGFIKSLNISSVQISFKANIIKNKKIRFDEMFGSGSLYNFGEDNIFMYDVLKNKLKVYYVPVPIGLLKEVHESSWFKGFNKDYMRKRGAIFYRMSKLLYNFLIIQFAIRKKRKYDFSVLSAMRYMYYGKKEYKKKVEKYEREKRIG